MAAHTLESTVFSLKTHFRYMLELQKQLIWLLRPLFDHGSKDTYDLQIILIELGLAYLAITTPFLIIDLSILIYLQITNRARVRLVSRASP